MRDVDRFEYAKDEGEKAESVSLLVSDKKKNVNYDTSDYSAQRTRRFSEDTDHRSGLIFWVKLVVSLWLFCAIIVVAFNNLFHFKLNDSVLIALLTTTTLNILGLAYIVLQGLFDVKE